MRRNARAGASRGLKWEMQRETLVRVRRSSRVLKRCHYAPCLGKMWRIKHDPVELQHASSARLECRDDARCPFTFRLRRRETGIDDPDLRGMDSGFRGETVAPRGSRLARETITVTKVRENRI